MYRNTVHEFDVNYHVVIRYFATVRRLAVPSTVGGLADGGACFVVPDCCHLSRCRLGLDERDMHVYQALHTRTKMCCSRCKQGWYLPIVLVEALT